MNWEWILAVIFGLTAWFLVSAYRFAKQSANDLRSQAPPIRLEDLSATAKRIALQQPPGWEGKLFAHVLKDSITRAEQLKAELAADRSTRSMSATAAPDWVAPKLSELGDLLESVAKVNNVEFSKVFAAGSAIGLMQCANALGFAYRKLLKWSHEMSRVRIDSEWDPFLREASHLTDQAIRELERLGLDLIRKIDEGLASGSTRVSLELELTPMNKPVFKKRLNVLKRRYGVR